MIRFLLDENISPVVAEQVTRKETGVHIVSLQRWHGGEFLNTDDEVILEAACREQLTLVTFDLSTIRPLLKLWAEEGRTHAGVIFIDDKSIANNDYGALVKAILKVWDRLREADLTDGVLFLSAKS